MPVYCFTTEEGQTHERVFHHTDVPAAIKVEGKKATRDIAAEHRGYSWSTGGKWPIHSDAAGCHPDQRSEMSSQLRSLGVPTEFDHQGRAVLRDRSHRKRFLKAMGMHDKNAFDRG